MLHPPTGRPADVVHILPHARALGGTERTVLDLLRSAELGDVRQRVVFVRPGSVRCFAEASYWSGQLRGPLRVVAAARTIVRMRPTVIHGWLLEGNVVGAVAKLLLPSASLVTSERNLGDALSGPQRVLEHLVARAETVATANSCAVWEAALDRVPRRAPKMRLIFPGIEPPERPSRPVTTTAVMVGHLHPVKDHGTALRAWAKLQGWAPGSVLTIVGDGPERSRLEALRQSLALRDVVRLIGQADPRPYLFGAQLYLSTSLAEGFSRSLLEALLAGVPAVVTGVGGIGDLPPGVVRTAPPRDHHAIARKLDEVLRDETAPRRAAEAAAVVATAFSPQTCHRAYRNLYRELGVA